MLTLTILAGIGATLFAAYRVMIKVKPKEGRSLVGRSAPEDMEALERRLMRHVSVLATEIGERNVFRPEGLRSTAAYISDVWTSQGLAVSEEAYEVAGQRCVNLIVEQKGSIRPDEIVLVGAHYDSVAGTRGANDNATGVALLLEMSGTLKRADLPRTLRFVAFVNEEPPIFRSEQMGSRVHARNARKRRDHIVAMLALETLGCYSARPRSQHYPFPFGFFYPDRGDFLSVIGNLRSRKLVVAFLRHFMEATDFPVEGAATFGWVPGIDWSDHWSFWKEGYPAIMLTDTAPYRYAEYHTPQDLPDRINGPEFARAAHGIIEAVHRLALQPFVALAG